MHVGRAVLVLLLALSVAVLPMKGGAAITLKSTDMSDMAMGMDHMSSAMEDMDCCPHKKVPTEKAIPDCCSSMATCPMNCLGFTGTSSFIVFPLLLGSVPLSLASGPLHSQTGSPPFRPPRI
jgi:hypothetical protein